MPCFQGFKVKDLEKYGYQYIGVTIKKKNYIYINAFRVESEGGFERFHKNWKTEPMAVCDGGQSFWGVLFDLDTSRFSQLSINGFA